MKGTKKMHLEKREHSNAKGETSKAKIIKSPATLFYLAQHPIMIPLINTIVRLSFSSTTSRNVHWPIAWIPYWLLRVYWYMSSQRGQMECESSLEKSSLLGFFPLPNSAFAQPKTFNTSFYALLRPGDECGVFCSKCAKPSNFILESVQKLLWFQVIFLSSPE